VQRISSGHGIAEWHEATEFSCAQIDSACLSQLRRHQLEDLSCLFLAKIVPPVCDEPGASSTSGHIYRHWEIVAVDHVLPTDSLGLFKQAS
jgi:hypothetical protein